MPAFSYSLLMDMIDGQVFGSLVAGPGFTASREKDRELFLIEFVDGQGPRHVIH